MRLDPLGSSSVRLAAVPGGAVPGGAGDDLGHAREAGVELALVLEAAIANVDVMLDAMVSAGEGVADRGKTRIAVRGRLAP
jgi:hypothetical protein